MRALPNIVQSISLNYFISLPGESERGVGDVWLKPGAGMIVLYMYSITIDTLPSPGIGSGLHDLLYYVHYMCNCECV